MGEDFATDLDGLIQQLRRIFDEDQVDVDQVIKLLGSYKSNPEDWMKFTKYTRNLVDRGNGKYNLMMLCWGEGQGSGIHDHANSHCFVKMLDGGLKEVMLEWPEGEIEQPMTVKDVNIYKKDQVAYINDSMGLHRMENESHSKHAVSLHLYCPPFGECYNFDERTGHKRKCCVVFHSCHDK
ncbi:Cysteine dioxygenase type 1 [Trichoplax sp. H2]|uniref:Cysteine dioxygenase n=1 Tax=Trichoplax adhaerens TaxID=10228 RepID=B3RIN9_TRIAD|nr:hypothetical protein TRIADDRAFT_49766 [Trichoplax adhaerens]EDV29752.1 hypothetical protein TRIADDRAFT_49766 [Trichoplax adhaerens]RDD47250.1 Cysteine dioxygenase type 1 [Trichoplax sp. H2]|eukprot:XP_002108954.1 hypothetical protein TRIADDRAFT_49766 [Trichoplax adhaerens]